MALKAGRVGVAPSQVKPDGTLNVTIPDPPAPTPATKLYAKELTLNKSKMSVSTLIESKAYLYKTIATAFPITLDGYTPLFVRVIDTYTDHDMFGASIVANKADTTKLSINFVSDYHGSSDDFCKVILYYAKNDDIETMN